MSEDQTDPIGSKKYKLEETSLRKAEEVTFEMLLSKMQEVAWENSVQLGFSVPDLLEKGLTWMVHRMQFVVKRYPRIGEEITVQSWPSGQDRLYTYRDYRIVDGEGKEITRGTSAWLMINISKRRPVSPGEVFDMAQFGDAERMPLDRQKLAICDDAREVQKIAVGPDDIDLNEHVTNTRYVEWAMEVVRENFNDYKKPGFLDMIFKEESKLEEQLLIIADESHSDELLLSIRNQSRDSDSFLIKIKL